MIIKELTYDEFDSFALNFNTYSVYQTSQYALIMNNQNYSSIMLGLINDDNSIIAATLLLIDKKKKYKKAYAPRGFLIDYNNFDLVKLFTKLIKSYLNKLNVMSLIINPPIYKNIHFVKENIINKNNYYDHILKFLNYIGFKHLGYNTYFEGIRPRFEAIIDLEKIDFDSLKKEFKTKIRSSEKDGINIYKGNSNDLNILYNQVKRKYPRDLKYLEDCYNFFKTIDSIDYYYTKLDTFKYLKETTKKLEEYEKNSDIINIKMTNVKKTDKILNKKMNTDLDVHKYKKQLISATNLLRDYPDGLITSSCLIARQKDEVTLLIDGHDIEYKNLNSKHLLIWELCKKYKKLGYKKFNLGGLASVNITNNKYKGLNDFKLGFNPYIIEYMGDLELVINNTLYFMYTNSNSIKKIIRK